MVQRHLSGWAVAGMMAGFLALAFVMLGGLSFGYSLRSAIWLAISGALLGAVAAPDLEPKAFRFPVLWQICFCVVGLEALVFYNKAGPIWYLVALVVGWVLGYTARHWTKYIDVP
jgi:hypothetical protein